MVERQYSSSLVWISIHNVECSIQERQDSDLMRVFEKIALDAVPTCTWSFMDDCEIFTLFCSMMPDRNFSNVPSELHGKLWGYSTKSQPAWSFFLLEVTSTVAPYTLNQWTVGFYQQDCIHWRQITVDDWGSSPYIQNKIMLHYQIFWCQGALYLQYPCNILLQFAVIISWEEKFFSQCGHAVLCLPFLVWFCPQFYHASSPMQ